MKSHKIFCSQNCDILRRAAEAGGLLVDAMINIQDGSKGDLPSVPLMVVENGCSSPCIDLRQVSSELAAAAKDADLVHFPTAYYFFKMSTSKNIILNINISDLHLALRENQNVTAKKTK